MFNLWLFSIFKTKDTHWGRSTFENIENCGQWALSLSLSSWTIYIYVFVFDMHDHPSATCLFFDNNNNNCSSCCCLRPRVSAITTHTSLQNKISNFKNNKHTEKRKKKFSSTTTNENSYLKLIMHKKGDRAAHCHFQK